LKQKMETNNEKPAHHLSQSRGQNIDIEIESPGGRRSLIIGLTWPALAESVLVSMVSIISMIMVGHLGSHAIGAVGLVIQPRFVMLAAFMALSVGSTAMVSRFKGAGDRENANMVLGQSLVIAAGITLVLCLAMFFWGEALLRLMAGKKISEETVQEALVFLRIQIFGFPTLAFTFVINAILRGVGNTRAAFYNNLVANIVIVIFNYCLIGGHFGFPVLGIAGASLAMVIGQCAALGMALHKVLSGKEFVRIHIKKLFHLEWSMIRRILNIGFPAMIEQVIIQTGMMLFTTIVASLGDYAFAAHMIAINIQQISFMIGLAFGAAATTLVGQCLGRKRIDLSRIYTQMTRNLSFLLAIIVSLFLFFGGKLIASLYSPDQELVHLVATMLRIIALMNPFSNGRLVYQAALRGAGDSRYVAIITFIGVLLMRPLVSIILIAPQLPFHLGLAGVWIALSSDGVVCYLLARHRFLGKKWEGIKV
jgi:putative MATE family efflux protein